jgi:hypothetical protein
VEVEAGQGRQGAHDMQATVTPSCTPTYPQQGEDTVLPGRACEVSKLS